MGSLDDLKILDFSTLLPGPYATLMLADMGAEVLKISSASRPDIVLDYPPFIGDTGVSASQAWLGRNKKTMFLNLKTGEGKAVVKELVKEYDIVLEQFRPGVMEKLGLGYEDLKAVTCVSLHMPQEKPFIYRSAIFIPPINPIRPSIMAIFR